MFYKTALFKQHVKVHKKPSRRMCKTATRLRATEKDSQGDGT